MNEIKENPVRSLRADWPFVWKSILGFWGLNVLYVIAQVSVTGEAEKLLDLYRASPFLVGMGLTVILWLALHACARLSLAKRLLVAAIVSVPAAITVTAYAVAVIYFFDPAIQRTGVTRTAADGTVSKRLPSGELQVLRKGSSRPEVVKLPSIREEFLERAPRMIADESFSSFFFFFAWGAFYVAVSSGQRLRTAEANVAEFRRLAQSSQLQALRYQVNPHFLYNVLNSLSSLIMTRRLDEAEKMILGLSRFFRATLAINPAADVTLSEEIALQRLYLDIEQVRFSSRLRVEVNLPVEVASALVPALLLQPIVENAVKYGVARTRAMVTLTISARREGGLLRLIVENDGKGELPAQDESGTGVGLQNVCQRLAVRYGEAAGCEYGVPEGGGYRVSIIMPLLTND